MNKTIKIALPKGRLLAETASLLKEAGWGLQEYTRETRYYHIASENFPYLFARIFHEKDIPIQVAIGNYDLGICGLDWIEELLSKYPGSELIKLKDLGYGRGSLKAYTAADYKLNRSERIRIASEYPNISETYAARLRLQRFCIYPVWGAAEVYPPENAEIAILADINRESIVKSGLVPFEHVLNFSAWLIANRRKWEKLDMGEILSSLNIRPSRIKESFNTNKTEGYINIPYYWHDENGLRIALPDGHQQPHTLNLFIKAGIILDHYSSSGDNRRPSSNLEGIYFKVIRPQDMPSQVASGNFDLAFTGKDWLKNHLYQFPSSPVVEMLDLKYAKVRIVAAVHESLGIYDTASLRRYVRSRQINLRIASEYVNIADRYARDNHLGMYRIIPTWGATEAFLPDDADLLIENTETGRTLARHNLKIIDTLFESTGCIIGRRDISMNSKKREKIETFISKIREVLEKQ